MTPRARARGKRHNPCPMSEDSGGALFAMWRFHMWLGGHGSYEAIHDKVRTGELRPFLCPDKDCQCRWKRDAGKLEPPLKPPRPPPAKPG
jgi:hypothetical protein